MISRRNQFGERFVFAADGKTLLSVHGKTCTGCLAVRGNCGRLTGLYVKQGRITGRALENLEAAQQEVIDELLGVQA
jgi:hypothetical protein